MADVITACNWCCSHQLGRLSKPKINLNHVVTLFKSVGGICGNLLYMCKIPWVLHGEGGGQVVKRLLAIWTMFELWEGEHWNVGNSRGKKNSRAIFNQSHSPDNDLFLRHSSMHCQWPIFLSLFSYFISLFLITFAPWWMKTLHLSQMKHILFGKALELFKIQILLNL